MKKTGLVFIVMVITMLLLTACSQGMFGSMDDLREKAIEANQGNKPAIVDAQEPIIVIQPLGKGYNIAEIPPPDPEAITVFAWSPDGGELSYQWYMNGTDSYDGANKLTGESSPSYTPDISVKGMLYYYVEITNTNTKVKGKQSAVINSNIVRINTTDEVIVDAETPYISTQPASATNTKRGVAVTLTVDATASDEGAGGGTLSYQWYRNDENSTTSGNITPVGGNSDSYAPDVSTVGTMYYYVVVTNTNLSVNGAQVVTKTSNVATITVEPNPLDTWTTVNTGIAINGRNCITYDGSQFLVGAPAGYMLDSNDGISGWGSAEYVAFNSKAVYGIAHNGSVSYVAVGAGGMIAYSPVGNAWIAVAASPFTSSSDVRGVTYGGGKWVAVGYAVNGKSIAYSSDNGATWTLATITPTIMYSPFAVAYNGSRFVAVGDAIAYSDNGTSWTAISQSSFNVIYSIAYGGSKFVAVGYGGKMAYSSDGENWVDVVDSGFGTTNITAITYGNGWFVAVGANGKIAFSSDGVNWVSALNTGTTASFRGIAYGGGRFVAVTAGNNAVWTDWP